MNRSTMVCIAAFIAVSGSLTGAWIAHAGEPAELPRPSSARVSGGTWCGPVTRISSAPQLAVYGSLARYVDARARVIAHYEEAGGETFVLCGPLHPREGG